MRISVVSSSYVVALNQRKWSLIAEDGNNDVQVITVDRWADMGRPLTAQRLAGKHHLHVINAMGQPHFYWFWFSRGRLMSAIASFDPDVVYVELEPQCLAAFQVAQVARRLHKPLVLFTWENLVRRYTFVQLWWARRVLRRTAHLIGGSERALTVARHYGYEGGSSVLPQFGVDTALFNIDPDATIRERFNLGNALVIGWVARVAKLKGIFTVLEALGGFSANWRLLVAGDGPDRSRAEQLARELGIDRQIFWMGAVPHAEIPQYLKAMDIFVLASIPTPDWEEQFGHVLIEAMSCGVPVIAADSGAIPGVVGDAGLVVPAGDAAALRGALERLAAEPPLRQQLSRRGRQRVLNQYSDGVIAGRLAAILGEAAHG